MSELNIKSSTIEKGLELAKDLLGKIVSPTVEELGLLFGDNIKHIRLKNQIRNLDKVRAIVEEKEITLKQVNLKVLFPYLEGIAVEEDETLQDIWANLFVNYIDSESNLKLTVYPQILKQLSTKEVEILKKASEPNEKRPGWGRNTIGFEHDVNSYELNNLERLGLMEANNNYRYENRGFYHDEVEVSFSGYMSITAFGLDFIEACTLKKETNDK